MNFTQYLKEKLGLGAEEYQVPEDKETQLYDFYALSLVNPEGLKVDDEDAAWYFKGAREKLFKALAENFVDAVYIALASEMAHFIEESYDQNDDNDLHIDKREQKLLYNLHKSLKITSYESRANEARKLGFSPEEVSDLALKVFDSVGWNVDYGGKSWLNVAKTYDHLLKTMKKGYGDNNIGKVMDAIDKIYNAQHNNGAVFSKVKEYYKNGNNVKWLQNVLDYKSKVKEPHVFIKHVSQQLKKPLTYAFKILYGKTLEDFNKEQKESKQKLDWESYEKMGGYSNEEWNELVKAAKKIGEGKVKVVTTPNGILFSLNGLYHSIDGWPAIIWREGSKYWYKSGQKHNENGPAYKDGHFEVYYLKDEKLSKEKWQEKVKEWKKESISFKEFYIN